MVESPVHSAVLLVEFDDIVFITYDENNNN